LAWQITTPALILLATSGIVSLTAWLVWRRRETQGGHELFRLLGAILIWSLAAALEAAASNLPVKIFWSKIEYLGATNTTPFLLIFCLVFTHRKHWISARSMILIWTMPVVTFLLAATNEWHHLIWTSFEPGPAPAVNLYIYHHGMAYWVFITYTYLYAFLAAFLILQEFLHTSHIYRRQNGTILFSMLFPWIGSIMYVFGPNPVPGLDTTPVSFAFTGLILAWGIFSTRLLDLIPIAHDVLLKNMQDGVIVIDPNNRVVETNPATAALLDRMDIPAGRDVFETFAAWPMLASILIQRPDLPSEISLNGNGTRFLDVRVTPILNQQGTRDGYLAVLREITERKQAEKELELKSREMEQRSITDELTGLYNRRHLDGIMEQEFVYSRRYDTPLSLALFDIDDFKKINDNFGHHAGDEALQMVANIIRSNLRSTDIPARMGGDEFFIVMPHTDLDKAWIVMERIRNELQSKPLVNNKAHITISAGVTGWCSGDTPEETLKRVDRLLYQAKEFGKNLVMKSD